MAPKCQIGVLGSIVSHPNDACHMLLKKKLNKLSTYSGCAYPLYIVIFNNYISALSSLLRPTTLLWKIQMAKKGEIPW